MPIERSFDVLFKYHQSFVPMLTRGIFFTAYARANAESDVNRGAEKVLQKLRQHVAAEYSKKLYQSLSWRTEAGIVAGEGHKKYLDKNRQ